MHSRNGKDAIPIEIMNTPVDPAVAPSPTVAQVPKSAAQSQALATDFNEQIQLLSDVNYPSGSVLQAGQSIVKTWQIQNIGDSDIQMEYKVIQVGGPPLNAYGGSQIGQLLRGQSGDVSALMVLPSVPGSYSTVWQVINELR